MQALLRDPIIHRVGMTTKDFGSRDLNLTQFVNMSGQLTKCVLVGACLLLVSGCAVFKPTSSVLHKPSCDLSPVLALRLPDPINTLAAVPRDKSFVENGTNVGEGIRNVEGLKEFFSLKRGEVEYRFELYFNAAAAVHLYEAEKHDPFAEKNYPVFREDVADGRSGWVCYTEQPRSDPEGGSHPMNYYISRAYFRLHNAFIRVTVQDDKPQNDKLTNAVKDLARMLDGALSAKQ